MKCKLVFLTLLLLHVYLTSATIRCKDDVTNEEYILNDSVDSVLTSEKFDTKMSQSMQHLNSMETKLNEMITQQNRMFIETSQQIIGKINNLESQVKEMIPPQQLVQMRTEQMEIKLNEISTVLKEHQKTIMAKVPSNCQEALSATHQSGVYSIYPPIFGEESLVCRRAFGEYDGDWTVVMHRFDGSVDFYRNWTEYKRGFGNLSGEFFIGMDRLHALTSTGTTQQLLIIMKDLDNIERYARYDSFKIANEDDQYKLLGLGVYTGNATDALHIHVNQKFSTFDIDNDDSEKTSCATSFSGAWWYYRCYNSNLFGRYSQKKGDTSSIAWHNMADSKTDIPYVLHFVQMLIKPAF